MMSLLRKVSSTWVALVTGIAATAVSGQEAGDTESIEPAVDTSVERPLEGAELEPAAGPTVVAADVPRGSSGGRAMDELELGRTEITGNQELPKVLYIVPWQKAGPADLMGKPVNSLLDEVLAPLDREEFVRQVDYYDDLYGEDNE